MDQTCEQNKNSEHFFNDNFSLDPQSSSSVQNLCSDQSNLTTINLLDSNYSHSLTLLNSSGPTFDHCPRTDNVPESLMNLDLESGNYTSYDFNQASMNDDPSKMFSEPSFCSLNAKSYKELGNSLGETSHSGTIHSNALIRNSLSTFSCTSPSESGNVPLINCLTTAELSQDQQRQIHHPQQTQTLSFDAQTSNSFYGEFV